MCLFSGHASALTAALPHLLERTAAASSSVDPTVPPDDAADGAAAGPEGGVERTFGVFDRRLAIGTAKGARFVHDILRELQQVPHTHTHARAL